MIVQDILNEVITLPEATAIADQMGYPLDRSNLLRYAQSGRLVARKSQGTWLTTRSALQTLILELAAQPRGRPREEVPAWATFKMTPELSATLDRIDEWRVQLSALERPAAEREQLRRELTVEAIYHTSHIEGNHLSLPEVRAIVEAFWAESEGNVPEAKE